MGTYSKCCASRWRCLEFSQSFLLGLNHDAPSKGFEDIGLLNRGHVCQIIC
ncbi:hypothetical protein KY284_011499 [Solanum tuberosum]|nr:hypothetical protein KY284_011492 [Solanum tuberosum]KAH0710072.1 hypothetical protein KY284_011499 [Solanum tuberosum]